uniref:Uncharacterized protein n=1 Tax=Glossina austeni TaxID=7395 RepID=A0A1A9V0I7_GLOAU
MCSSLAVEMETVFFLTQYFISAPAIFSQLYPNRVEWSEDYVCGISDGSSASGGGGGVSNGGSNDTNSGSGGGGGVSNHAKLRPETKLN